MALNDQVTTGELLPGFYGYVLYGAQGTSGGLNNDVLLIAFQTSSAQRNPNQAFLPASQQEADDAWGRGSDLARLYRATISQPQAQGARVFGLGITAPSGGVASIYKIKIYVSSTNPAKPGTLQLWISSRAVPAVGFDTTDTADTIGAALASAIGADKDLPIVSASNSSGVVTITYIHKGTTGEDLPFRCDITPGGTGVTASWAQAVFSGTAGAGGSVKFTLGARSVSASITGSDTASAIASNVVTTWTTDNFPLTAVVDGSSNTQVNFLFVNGEWVRRMNAAIITTTTTTVDLGSGATDGTGSATNFTYNGTQGTGAPSLTTALTNLSAGPPYSHWSCFWVDTATVGALATNIQNNANGSISGQKQQKLTLASPVASSVAGAIATGSSPNLTTSDPRFTILWTPDVTVQAGEIAGRIAAARAAAWIDTPQKNWNGFQVVGNDQAPLLLPTFRPTLLAQNAALRTYALAPVVPGASGNLEVIKGRTTSLSTDKRQWSWSAEAQASYHVLDLKDFLRTRFSGGSLVRFSEPKVNGIFDDNSFVLAIQERMRFWEGQGNYDGADALADGAKASRNQNNPNREDCRYPESPVLDLDQVVFTGMFTSPGQ